MSAKRTRAARKKANTYDEELAGLYMDARKRRVLAEKVEADLAAKLCLEVGDADGLDGETWSVTYRAPSIGATRWKEVALALGANEDHALVLKHTSPAARRFTFTLKG